MFEVSDDGVPSNLVFEFIDLVPTFGESSIAYEDLKFLTLPLSDYGVSEISATSLSEFRKALEDDKDMALEYLTRKLGFDATIDEEVEMAYAIYEDKDLITSSKHKTGEFICLMHKSIGEDEYNDCVHDANGVEEFVDASIFLS